MSARIASSLVAALLVLIVVAGALLVLPAESRRSRIQVDRDHLHRLWENYLSTSASGGSTPGARGYRFWPALLTGEGAYRSGYVLHPTVGGRLVVSPNDPVADMASTGYLLVDVLNGTNGKEQSDIGPQHISYAGPRDSVFRAPLLGRGDTIVGTTGTRVYDGGFVYLRANLQTGFMETVDGQTLPDTVADVGDELPSVFRRQLYWPYVTGNWYGDDADQPQTQPQR